jgi:apolipoprotein N-acyltransferase
MQVRSWKQWAGAVLAAGLLELPFPLAGPMPPWRSVFAWFGMVPLLVAILSAGTMEGPKPLRRAFLLAYACGILWYMGNCYWVRDTMMRYGDMPVLAPTLLLIGYSMVLGLYFGLFGLGLALVRRASGSARLALAFAPVLWTALELAAARITSVPWDQLGYSQVDNGLVNQLAPWTGVYGISFVVVLVNALLAGALLLGEGSRSEELKSEFNRAWQSERLWCALGGIGLFLGPGFAGLMETPPKTPTTATAVLVQPNLDVSADNNWMRPGEWDRHIEDFTRMATQTAATDKRYIAGIPQTGAPWAKFVPPANAAHPELVVWPESPAPFMEVDPRFDQMAGTLAKQVQAPLIVGGLGTDYAPEERELHDYNSAMVFGADGEHVGRYDKIHLVPFGEYIPFRRLIFFAHKLTGRVSDFSRGETHKVFRLNGHRYGIFICYEAVFADEVREFEQLGAEVLVNVSDDGWYGDTSAPWQHLNMTRMRAIENRRWILRDTNNGVTAAIDPYGRVRQSIPRHVMDALPAEYGFRDDVTFYSAHGDLFAWLCAFLSVGILAWSGRKLVR